MSKNTFVGALLATTVALSALVGCQVPSPAGTAAGAVGANPPAGTQAGQKPGTIAAQPMTTPATTPKALAVQNGAEIAAAMSEEREAEDYNALAADGAARYNIFAVGGPKAKPGEVAITAEVEAEDGDDAEEAEEATEEAAEEEAGKGKGKAGKPGKVTLKADVKAKLEARLAKLETKRAARLLKVKGADKVKAAAGKAAWVDNGDGTKTKSFEFSIEKTAGGKTMSRSRKMSRTVNIETGALVAMSAEFSHATPNGASHKMTRTKTLQEDGSYLVVFHSEITHKNGTSRVCDWTKTIAADGTVTGTGKIEWKDAAGAVTKSNAITFGGTEEEETATSTEGGTTTTVEAPVDGEIEAEVTDPAGTTEIDLVEGEDGTVESSTEVATGTESPAPAASPAASTEPAASASPAAEASPSASPSTEASPEASESPAASPAAEASPAA